MTQHVVQWFGRSPWGPGLESEDDHFRAERIPAPVGMPCLNCGEAVREDDDGQMSVAWSGTPEAPVGRRVAQHRECLLLSTVGHEVGLCTCTDYEGLTYRQAALEADRRFGRWAREAERTRRLGEPPRLQPEPG